MNLSANVTDALQLASDTMHIKDTIYPVLVQKVVQYALSLNAENNGNATNTITDDESLSSVDVAVLKAVTGALLTLVFKCLECDAGELQISSALEDCKYTPDRVATFVKIYEKAKPDLKLIMSSIQHSPDHIVDADWRLDYHIKNNMLEKVDEPTFLIRLHSEKSNGLGKAEHQFECTVVQLQDLVSKLRDASKCLERLTQL